MPFPTYIPSTTALHTTLKTVWILWLMWDFAQYYPLYFQNRTAEKTHLNTLNLIRDVLRKAATEHEHAAAQPQIETLNNAIKALKACTDVEKGKKAAQECWQQIKTIFNAPNTDPTRPTEKSVYASLLSMVRGMLKSDEAPYNASKLNALFRNHWLKQETHDLGTQDPRIHINVIASAVATLEAQSPRSRIISNILKGYLKDVFAYFCLREIASGVSSESTLSVLLNTLETELALPARTHEMPETPETCAKIDINGHPDAVLVAIQSLADKAHGQPYHALLTQIYQHLARLRDTAFLPFMSIEPTLIEYVVCASAQKKVDQIARKTIPPLQLLEMCTESAETVLSFTTKLGAQPGIPEFIKEFEERLCAAQLYCQPLKQHDPFLGHLHTQHFSLVQCMQSVREDEALSPEERNHAHFVMGQFLLFLLTEYTLLITKSILPYQTPQKEQIFNSGFNLYLKQLPLTLSFCADYADGNQEWCTLASKPYSILLNTLTQNFTPSQLSLIRLSPLIQEATAHPMYQAAMPVHHAYAPIKFTFMHHPDAPQYFDVSDAITAIMRQFPKNQTYSLLYAYLFGSDMLRYLPPDDWETQLGKALAEFEQAIINEADPTQKKKLQTLKIQAASIFHNQYEKRNEFIHNAFKKTLTIKQINAFAHVIKVCLSDAAGDFSTEDFVKLNQRVKGWYEIFHKSLKTPTDPAKAHESFFLLMYSVVHVLIEHNVPTKQLWLKYNSLMNAGLFLMLCLAKATSIVVDDPSQLKDSYGNMVSLVPEVLACLSTIEKLLPHKAPYDVWRKAIAYYMSTTLAHFMNVTNVDAKQVTVLHEHFRRQFGSDVFTKPDEDLTFDLSQADLNAPTRTEPAYVTPPSATSLLPNAITADTPAALHGRVGEMQQLMLSKKATPLIEKATSFMASTENDIRAKAFKDVIPKIIFLLQPIFEWSFKDTTLKNCSNKEKELLKILKWKISYLMVAEIAQAIQQAPESNEVNKLKSSITKILHNVVGLSASAKKNDDIHRAWLDASLPAIHMAYTHFKLESDAMLSTYIKAHPIQNENAETAVLFKFPFLDPQKYFSEKAKAKAEKIKTEPKASSASSSASSSPSVFKKLSQVVDTVKEKANNVINVAHAAINTALPVVAALAQNAPVRLSKRNLAFLRAHGGLQGTSHAAITAGTPMDACRKKEADARKAQLMQEALRRKPLVSDFQFKTEDFPTLDGRILPEAMQTPQKENSIQIPVPADVAAEIHAKIQWIANKTVPQEAVILPDMPNLDLTVDDIIFGDAPLSAEALALAAKAETQHPGPAVISSPSETVEAPSAAEKTKAPSPQPHKPVPTVTRPVYASVDAEIWARLKPKGPVRFLQNNSLPFQHAGYQVLHTEEKARGVNVDDVYLLYFADTQTWEPIIQPLTDRFLGYQGIYEVAPTAVTRVWRCPYVFTHAPQPVYLPTNPVTDGSSMPRHSPHQPHHFSGNLSCKP